MDHNRTFGFDSSSSSSASTPITPQSAPPIRNKRIRKPKNIPPHSPLHPSYPSASSDDTISTPLSKALPHHPRHFPSSSSAPRSAPVARKGKLREGEVGEIAKKKRLRKKRIQTPNKSEQNNNNHKDKLPGITKSKDVFCRSLPC